MAKRLFFFFLAGFFLFFSCTDGNQVNIDNSKLKKYLTAAKNNDLNQNQRISNNNLAFSILKVSDIDNSNLKNLYEVSANYFRLLQDQELNQSAKFLLNNARVLSDTLYMAKAYYILGSNSINFQRNDSAFFYLLKSEKLFLKLKDSSNLGQNYIDKAFVQLYESDWSGAELSSIQALNYYQKNPIAFRQYDAYNIIGISSNELKNYENAIAYHKRAITTAQNINNGDKLHLEANSRNNLGVVYQYRGDNRQAIINFELALLEKNLLEDNPYLYAMITDNLAYSKFKMDDLTNLPQLFYSSLKIRKENNLYSGIIINKIHLSEYFAKLGDTIRSQNYAIEAVALAKQTKIAGDILGSLKQVSLVEHKNSSKYSKEYIIISDSLQLEERKSKDKFARIQFETDQILVQNDVLEEQNRNLLFFFIGTLLVGTLLFVIRNQRARNRELILIQSQQKSNEHIYGLLMSQQSSIEKSRSLEKKRIAQELHDGVLGRLFGARLNLDSLNKFTDQQSITDRNNYLSELKNIEQDIREISHDLNREKHLLINNFVAIITNLLEDQKSTYKSNLTFRIDEDIEWENINNTVKINIYRILQESLHNANKYSDASNIDVNLFTNEKFLILKVTDNGRGFNILNTKKGIGLQNIGERAKNSNGTFTINSIINEGTTVELNVPFI